MRIVTRKEIMEMEQVAAKEHQISDKIIIENIAVRSADYIDSFFKQSKEREIVIFAGKGYNGANGLAIARHLVNKGWSVRSFVFFKEKEAKKETLKQLEIARAYGVKVNTGLDATMLKSYFSQNSIDPIMIDALLGVSARLPLPDLYYEAIKIINHYAAYTIALDLPSGVHCDTGEVMGEAVKADLTLAMGMPKLGCFIAEGLKYVGEINSIDMGLSKSFFKEGNKFLLGADTIVPTAHSRSKFSDKRSFGHTLVLGGSHGLTGSVVMASQAALKVGAGLVTAVTWADQYNEMLCRLIPEVMTGYIPDDEKEIERLAKDFSQFSSVVIGPGLARSKRAKKLVETVLLNFRGPVIVDADALNVMDIKKDGTLFYNRPYPTVLTPHLGELARFANIDIAEVQKNPIKCLQEVVAKSNCTILLKGAACTYIAYPSEKIYFNFFPNDGMATAGVGDVLAGILGGLMAQQNVNLDQEMVVNQGILVHSLAGHFATENLGVRPTTAISLIDAFPKAFSEINTKIDTMINGRGDD